VIAIIERLELDVEMKNVSEDESAMSLLMEKGGKSQTPYLVDSEKDVAMYESDDIVKHLQDNYGGDTNSSIKPRVHISDSTCVSCEG